MKQKTRTLSDALKTFPKSWNETITKEIPDNFYSLNFLEKLDVQNNCNSMYYCSVNNNRLFFGQKTTFIHRTGKRFYPSHIWTNCIIIENNKITVSKLSIYGLIKFLEVSGLDIRYIKDELLDPADFYNDGRVRNLLVKPSIIGAILRKKIYSEKTFYKYVRSKIYKLQDFDWKILRNYLKCANYIPIADLTDFTKNAFKSMEVLTKYGDTYMPLYRDVIDCAIQLNETVDFTWSCKRMALEHTRQIETLQFREIQKKEELPVFSEIIDAPFIKMLNTEKEVYIEAKTMHHCLYNCYWRRIKDQNYMAFHMSYPEDCTFSCRLITDTDGNKKVNVDQAYLAYDKKVSDETLNCIHEFVNQNKVKIEKLLT